jgi:uncharacterized protein (DUF58 family)
LPLPSRRLLLLVALAAPLFLVGVGVALAVNLLLVVAAVIDALRVPGAAEVRVVRRSPARLALGGEGEVGWEVESAVGRPVTVRLTDDVPPGIERIGADTAELVLAPRGRGRGGYRVRAGERGEFDLGDLHLRVLGPLGLVWRERRERRVDRVRVQPGVLEVGRYRRLAQHHRLREAGLRSVRERGEGTSFESLRDYIRGDDPRRIDWKATARRSTTTVRQFEAERSQNVMLMIDAGRLMTERLGERDRLDHALSASLLLADVAAHHGDRVGVFVFADRVQQFLPPSRAPISRMAEAFARVEARMVEPDYPGAFSYLAKSLRRRSLLVLFCDVLDTRVSAAMLAHLGAATRRHLPLVVALRNPALEAAAEGPAESEAEVFRRTAAEELLQARAHALATMQRAGILVADARPHDLIAAVVNRYLEVKQRGLL